jgi:ubiquinone/menaquinone biosynthesis C-methylase UbiE
VFNRLVSYVRKKIYLHRARWTARHLRRFIGPNDRVLDIGAGDCRLDELLQRRVGCEIVPVDVEDFNETNLPLTLFDGKRLPFDDNSFDVVLLIFVLHHAQDVKACLEEARRVARGSVLVFEDVTTNLWDRFLFRIFHRWLDWWEGISYPYREWSQSQWTELADSLDLGVAACVPLSSQLWKFSCRHVAFEWRKLKGTGSFASPG